jgi:hypothetical protein
MGVGDGDGDGDGDGVGTGVCAHAADEAVARVRPTTRNIATAATSLRMAEISFARDRRDEQHMNAIPKRSANSTKTPNYQRAGLICPQLSGTVNRSSPSAMDD